MANEQPDYRGRLLRLAELLDSLPPERFNYGQWAGDDWKGAANLSCGTSACALGWATTIPELQKEGLCLRRDPDYEEIAVTLGEEADGVDPLDQSVRSGAAVFGLTREESEFLFIPKTNGEFLDPPLPWDGPHWKAPAPEVAAHIRRFVAHKWPEVKP